MNTQTLIPAELARYAALAGREGTPVYVSCFSAPLGRDKFANLDGQPMTPTAAAGLREQGFTSVAVRWTGDDLGRVADFMLSELVPMTGLAACGIDAPVPA